MARYDVQDTSGDDINSAVVPGNINDPVIFIAPSARTTASGEIWLATSSTDSNYGGCVVWVSNDDSHYKPVGRIEGQARQGVLLAALPSATGTDETDTLSVDMSLSGGELESVSQVTVNRLDTLCYVGGEFLAFRDVTTVDVNRYDMDYLKRGLYGSSTGAISGADFVAIDNAIFRYRFNKMAVGHLLYFKFQAFNQFGAGLQNLADCTAYEFVPVSDGGLKALLSDLTNPFRGLHASLIALQTALPTANAGDYAQVDAGAGSAVQNYFWDVTDTAWVLSNQASYTAGTNITIIGNVISATGIHSGGATGELLMYGGFNEDIDYHEGTGLVPNFLAADDGDLYYY